MKHFKETDRAKEHHNPTNKVCSGQKLGHQITWENAEFMKDVNNWNKLDAYERQTYTITFATKINFKD